MMPSPQEPKPSRPPPENNRVPLIPATTPGRNLLCGARAGASGARISTRKSQEPLMSVLPSDIVVYGSANMPETDGAPVGGAVDFSKRCAWYDLSANDTIDAVSSSSSDTATKVQALARNASGVVVTSAVATLSGQTPIANIGSLGTVERMLAAVITGGAVAGLSNPGGTAAVGDVALYRHTAVISAHTAQTGAANASG